MNKLFTLLAAIVLMAVSTISTYSQVTVSGAVTGNTNYTTLKGAFDVINANTQTGTNIVISITGNTTETASAQLNAGAWTTLTIQPSGGAARTISGAITAGSPLINLNGADNVTIDGLNTGGNSLTISNTTISATTGTSTIRFIADATNNTITRCSILGSATMASGTNGGNIFFSTATTIGNDNNTISFCNIGPAGSNLPTKGIYGNGSTTSITHYNSGININNCNIFDYFSATVQHAGIYVSGACTDWTINNNKFYQTATRTHTAGSIHAAIQLASSNINNCKITNNIIGYSNSSETGTYTYNATTVGTGRLFAIYVSAHGTTTVTTISNNKITNISYTGTVATTNLIYLAGIFISSGTVDVTNNIIGSTTGNSSITATFNGGAINAFVEGIDSRGNSRIDSNSIGSIDVSGTSTGIAAFYGIAYSGTPTASKTFNNNIIGSTSTSGSIRSLSSAQPCNLLGLYVSVGSVSHTVSGNIIANFTDNSITTSSQVSGLVVVGTGVQNVLSNTVYNLSTLSRNTSGPTNPAAASVVGIVSVTSTGSIYSQNEIYSLSNLTTNNSAVNVIGMVFDGDAASRIVSRNKIYDLRTTSSSSSAMITGIFAFWGSATVSNNMIDLTNGESTTDNSPSNYSTEGQQSVMNNNSNLTTRVGIVDDNIFPDQINKCKTKAEVLGFDNLNKNTNNSNIQSDASTNNVIITGIYDDAFTSTQAWTYYYNSVYIGGSTTGTANSYIYRRVSATTVTHRNNLFYNARTSAGGFNVIYSNEAPTPASGWSSNATNYNTMINADTSALCRWGTTNYSIYGWRTTSSCDKQTWRTSISDVTPTELFTDLSTGDLSINKGNAEAWIVTGKGIAVTGQNIDYNGDSRFVTISEGTTDIGADECLTPAIDPPAAIESGTPSANTTTSYTLWGRTIAEIFWNSGGSQPTAITATYFSGVNPPNVEGGNYANSYTTLTPTGSLVGASYELTYYFGDNETYTIGTPSTNTVLCKYDTYWKVFPLGTNFEQTQLTYNTSSAVYSAKVTGLLEFSNFALSDASFPLPVVLSEFNISTLSRDANLKWVTSTEVNNKGFALERRNKLEGENAAYSPWKEVAFINGHGTTNEPKTYTYSDKKLNSGIYQYRLRQVDYNSNFEYFSPSQSDIAIGNPGKFDIGQNYPNPSNPKSKIDYQIPFDGLVSIKIYDIIGREVAVIVNEQKEIGYYSAEFDGSSMASGVYFYRIIAEGNGEKFTKTLKMILVK